MPLTDRIIDISESAASVSARNGLLVIESSGSSATIPLAETAALVIAHPAVRISHAALAGLCTSGAMCVVCDERLMPTGMLVPLQANSIQAERFAAQSTCALPVKKRLWKKIVAAKIHAQAALLKDLSGSDYGLGIMTSRVRSGDPENMEAQASRRYWPALFGEQFRRAFQANDQNRYLNYGYAVLRAIVARALCASGLHPSLGIHHHNRYDAFCLADDIMEPFRPIVDRLAYEATDIFGPDAMMGKEVKAHLIRGVSDKRFLVDGESRSIFDTMSRVSASLAAVFEGKADKLYLPAM